MLSTFFIEKKVVTLSNKTNNSLTYTKKMIRKMIFSAVLALTGITATAQENPLWMRYPAISPDGETIVFS